MPRNDESRNGHNNRCGAVQGLQPVMMDIRDQRLREEAELLCLAAGREVLNLDGLAMGAAGSAVRWGEFQEQLHQLVGAGVSGAGLGGAGVSVAIGLSDWDSPLLELACLRGRKIGFEDFAGAQLNYTADAEGYVSPRGELACWIGAVDPLRIGIYNATGGSGATITAALLAQHLSDRGEQVVIVDDTPFTAGAELSYGIERDEAAPLPGHGAGSGFSARSLNGIPTLTCQPVDPDANAAWWRELTDWAEKTSTHLVIDYGQAPSDPAGWAASPQVKRPSHDVPLHITVLLAQLTLPSLMAACHAQPHLDNTQLPGPVVVTRQTPGARVCISHAAAVLGDFPAAHMPEDWRLAEHVTAGAFAGYLRSQQAAGGGSEVYRAAGQILEEVTARAAEQRGMVLELADRLLNKS